MRLGIRELESPTFGARRSDQARGVQPRAPRSRDDLRATALPSVDGTTPGHCGSPLLIPTQQDRGGAVAEKPVVNLGRVVPLEDFTVKFKIPPGRDRAEPWARFESTQTTGGPPYPVLPLQSRSAAAQNAKGLTLVKALPRALDEIAAKGGRRKAVIFTESVRTQTTYLAALLSANGYADDIVLLNGQNNDPASKAIYADWLVRHKGTEAVSGSRTDVGRARLGVGRHAG